MRSWGYQLQRVDPERIAASPFDLVVVDYSRTGKDTGRFDRAEVDRMRQRPDGSSRVVLAYLSIGEAEDYRYYWRDRWVETVDVLEKASTAPAPVGAMPERAPSPRLKALRVPRLSAPAWLGRESDAWPGNYLVRYWDAEWQSLIYQGADSYLARILAAGFDGVFLDRIDTFQVVSADRPSARQDMIRLVVEIARVARRAKPDFLVVPQNGEQLLADPTYLAVIDAIAKEDFLFGEEEDGRRNSPSTVSRSMRWLAPALNRGVPVLIVEYVRDQAVAEALKVDIERRGFVPYFAVRALDRLILPGDFAAPTAEPAASSPPAAALPMSPAAKQIPPRARRLRPEGQP
ncbi:MAG: endo alpha-1,4 polygalactosaminidase [Hyphomicrobiaceae bacterium]